MKWYKVDGEFKPEREVLAKNESNDVLVGFVHYDEDEQIWECSSTEGNCMLLNVTHFIPVSELLINIHEQK